MSVRFFGGPDDLRLDGDCDVGRDTLGLHRRELMRCSLCSGLLGLFCSERLQLGEEGESEGRVSQYELKSGLQHFAEPSAGRHSNSPSSWLPGSAAPCSSPQPLPFALSPCSAEPTGRAWCEAIRYDAMPDTRCDRRHVGDADPDSRGVRILLHSRRTRRHEGSKGKRRGSNP